MKKAIFIILQRKIIWLLLFFGWAVFIILSSLWPDRGEVMINETVSFRWDYLVHFISYFLLSLLFFTWRCDPHGRIKSMEFTIFLTLGLMITLLTEYIQIFIPGRSFNINDMILNAAGLITGSFTGYYILIKLIIKRFI